MSVTTELYDKIAEIKTYLVFIAFLYFKYSLVFALKAIGYEKGVAAEILKAVITKPVNLAIWCIVRIQLLLFKNKVSMERALKETTDSVLDTYLNLESLGFKFPDPMILILLCLKTQVIAVYLILNDICTYVVRSLYFYLRRVSDFVQSNMGTLQLEIKN